MSGYTKLFNSIVTSTIWSEDDKTRIVWITMLALADKNGEVQGSIPGVARIAGVPVDDCRVAILKFLSPDPDSRTKDDEGRRVEEIDGGWSLLNHRKYREMASKEEAKETEAKRKARYRAKMARNGKWEMPKSVPCESQSVPCESQSVPENLHIAEAEAYPFKKEYLSVTGREESIEEYSEEILTLWQSFPAKSRERSSKKKINDEWRKAKNKPPLSEVIGKVKSWANGHEWKKDNGQFAPGAHLWIKDRKWESDTPAEATNGLRPTIEPTNYKNPTSTGHRNLWD